MKKQLSSTTITMGCDPEFFFRKNGEVIGSDIILPSDGLSYGDSSKIIVDGVQAELNPTASFCREILARNIHLLFDTLKNHLQNHKSVSIDFSQTIKLDDDEFEKLSDNSKKFGCMPSKNSNRGGRNGKITVNPASYRYRSAGGHIHLGVDDENPSIREVYDDPVRLVKVLDILVGNTCVLLDRDPGNIERRKVYGKAGEFRTPPHGVEYRTLSNFWLKHYVLMSLVMGLARHAVMVVKNDMDGKLLELVDMKEISQAINTNDFTLALRNFKKIEKYILSITPSDTDWYPINSSNIKCFKHFIKKGISYWFKEDPVEHWCSISTPSIEPGINEFLLTTVKEDMIIS